MTMRDVYLVFATWCALAALLAGAFTRYFDISDEGMYLYLLMQGKDATFVSPFYTLFHYIGEWFDHSLLGYRWLSLSLISVSALYLAHSATHYLHMLFAEIKLPTYFLAGMLLISSLFSFWFMVTFSYNNLATIAAYMWVGALLMLTTPCNLPKASLHVSVLVAALFLAFLARPPFGIILLLITPCAVFYQQRVLRCGPALWLWLLATAAISALIGALILDNTALLQRLLVIYPATMAASHANIIGRAILQIGAAVAEQYPLLIAVLLFAGSRFLKPYSAFAARGARLLAWLAILAFMISLFGVQLAIAVPSPDPIRFAGLLLVTNVVFVALSWFQNPPIALIGRAPLKPLIFAVVLCTIASLGSAFGSNGNIMSGAVYSMALLAILPLGYGLLAVEKSILSPWILRLVFAGTALCIALVIYQNFYFKPYRVSGWSEQTARVTNNPAFTHIRIDAGLAKAIGAVQQALKDVGFDILQDRIMAYPDMPGLLAATGARSFGSPWMVTRYPDIDVSNCAHISTEPTSPIRHVYFLRGIPISEGLSACLAQKLVKAEGFASHSVGDFYHHRNLETETLVLEGPYRLRRK
jgi:hypothetical protein